jgi:hypothetical protein
MLQGINGWQISVEIDKIRGYAAGLFVPSIKHAFAGMTFPANDRGFHCWRRPFSIFFVPAVLKRSPFRKLLLPCAFLVGKNREPAGQLGQVLMPPNCPHSDLRLESRCNVCVLLSFSGMSTIGSNSDTVSTLNDHPLFCVEAYGAIYTAIGGKGSPE